MHILSFSLIMLNTDLHNRNLNPRKKMKLEDFIRNNRGINDGQDLPRELLEALYNEIKVTDIHISYMNTITEGVVTDIRPLLKGRDEWGSLVWRASATAGGGADMAAYIESGGVVPC